MPKVIILQKLKTFKLILAIIFFPITALLFLLDGVMDYIVRMSDGPGNTWAKSVGLVPMGFFEGFWNGAKQQAYNQFYDWVVTYEGEESKCPGYNRKVVK